MGKNNFKTLTDVRFSNCVGTLSGVACFKKKNSSFGAYPIAGVKTLPLCIISCRAILGMNFGIAHNAPPNREIRRTNCFFECSLLTTVVLFSNGDILEATTYKHLLGFEFS